MQNNKIVGIIPARYNSSRLAGKPLKDIHGKPMIYWVAKRVEASRLQEYYVATDDNRIFDSCQEYSIPCVMTSEKCLNGTERVAEAATMIKADYYINIQGDEPCIDVDSINTLIKALKDFKEVDFVQAISEITDIESVLDSSIVKVAVTDNNEILYYSRLPIPYSRGGGKMRGVHYKSLGLYLYSRKALRDYLSMTSTKLENIEHIEQLRILENKMVIKAVKVSDGGMSVDTADDLVKIRDKYRGCFK